MPTVRSACPLDCPDTCSLEVTVADGRVTRLDGSSLNPLTEGLICGKVRGFGDHLYGAERLSYPAVRDGSKGSGRFRRVSWDEALGQVARRLAEVRDRRGGEAILPFNYGGSNGRLTHESIDARLFRRLGASQLLHTFCAAPTGAAHGGLYGRMPGVALEDYVHANLIAVWGCNPSATSIHLVTVINQARARGAALLVVDPRATPLARQADVHLTPRVGTDLPLALSMIDWLFRTGRADHAFLAARARNAETLAARAAEWPIERAAQVCDVRAADIEAFVARYADAATAVMRCGWGQERNRNGGSASAAVLALPAVAGKLGVRGGGFTMSNSRAFGFDGEAAINEPPPDVREVNMSQLGRALIELDDPPIEALVVYNSNPLATAPDQQRVLTGLTREDLFTVVIEQVHTDTADYADVLLPATTFLEHRELKNGYGAMHLFDLQPVIAPVGEARPNYEIFLELCDRLELSREGDPRTPAELVAALLASTGDAERLRADLDRDGIAAPTRGSTPIQLIDVDVPIIDLVPAQLDAEAPGGLYAYHPDPATDAYPLALISPATSRTISSTFGQLAKKEAAVELSLADAEARQIVDGDPVRIWNELGEVLCVARVTPHLRAGVASLPKGLWRKSTRNRATSNALCPDTEADLGRGACYNDARVQIART
ncbi:MAG TPA: molybdopterin-dependent oxidoreductase [Kofleriaceae bacterium]|nr:molybdopterin-dependent oxidoreductase [Kofleriaceae bacterium]